jgi:zinc protease
VTPAGVQAFTRKYLQKNNRVVVHGVPGKQNLGTEVPKPTAQAVTAAQATDSQNVDEAWRRTAPKPSAQRAVRIAQPQSFQLSNGLTVIVLPQTGSPVVSATLVVKTGSDANPGDKPGLASFTTATLDQGTTTRNALQLSDEAAQIGATLSTATSTDSSTVTTSSLARNFPAALNLLADVALHPSFPPDEIERIRAARLADIVQQRSNPNLIASNVMAAALYGREHPYGVPGLGTEASIKKLTRDELQGFWREHFVPANAALVVAGAITVPELRKLSESTFGAWPRGTSTVPAVGAPATTNSKLIIVDRPGSPQTQLRVAMVGVARSNPDYVPVRVMNALLGGLFSSRINMNLRETHGYTYGARSQFTFNRHPGPFEVSSGVRTDVTAPAVREVFSELKRIAATRVTPAELTLAKDAITQSLPGSFETSDRTVANLSALFTYGLPLNYYSNLPEQISVVDAQAVQEVARKYIGPGKFVVIAVGDRAKIGQALETELGTPAELRDADGLPATPVRP